MMMLMESGFTVFIILHTSSSTLLSQDRKVVVISNENEIEQHTSWPGPSNIMLGLCIHWCWIVVTSVDWFVDAGDTYWCKHSTEVIRLMVPASILIGEQYIVLGGRQQLLFERRVEKASRLLYTTPVPIHNLSSAISSFIRSIVSCSWLGTNGLGIEQNIFFSIFYFLPRSLYSPMRLT